MNLSGQITVTTAGTAVQGPSVTGGKFILKAHPDNTDTVWVGNVSGDVANTNGFPLDPGEALPVNVPNLNIFYFDADVNGEKICWVRDS
jgi:hypothetical protein